MVLMGRAGYIRKRLLLSVFVVFGVTIVIFGMVHFLPGDPATILLGERATTQNIAALINIGLQLILGLLAVWIGNVFAHVLGG